MSNDSLAAKTLKLSGTIQGVGFRPFVYRLACSFNLVGYIKNAGAEVFIFIQGDSIQLEYFIHTLQKKLPPLACINTLNQTDTNISSEFTHFSIITSSTGNIAQHNIKDYALCDDCLLEFNNPNDRRYHYPFISCTNCGPRFAILQRFPFDRINTSFKQFPLCKVCNEEYKDPSNRRFHAQNISCPKCGPQYSLHQNNQRENKLQKIILQCCELLLNGHILCIKGVTGYRLFCNAENKHTIAKLRKAKQRPDKPFAVMFPVVNNFSILKSHLKFNENDFINITKNTRPIVLLSKNISSTLPNNIAEGLNTIGAMLPATGFEYLLLKTINRPLVATSANTSNGNILTDKKSVEEKISSITPIFLHHNLHIEQGLDDSVFKANVPIRLGRAYAPTEYKLPFTLDKPVLALGAQSKNTLAFAWSNTVVVSPHLGNMDNIDVWQNMQKLMVEFQTHYNVKISHYLIDKHPAYTSHQWIKKYHLPHSQIQHHYSHASALMFEHQCDLPTLVFTWDGTGYGENNTLWGGEGLYGKPGNWKRVFSFRQFKLPGGQQAIHEPWRIAASLNWHVHNTTIAHPNRTILLKKIWDNDINCPRTSSVGRLFDAAAVYLGLIENITFDGQAAMLLEALAIENTCEYIPLKQTKAANGIYYTDWAPLVQFLQDNAKSIEFRATVFHYSLAQALLNQTTQLAKTCPFKTVGLTGGVFQNTLLVKITQALLISNGYHVLLNKQLPANDASIALGQIIEYGMCSEQKNY